MIRYFNLNGCLIFESPERNGWIDWVESPDGSLNCLIGDIKIDKDIDVTILNHFRDRTGESKHRNLSDARKYVESLPKWEKTKYYSRITDLGSSGLLDCKTGDVIDSGFEYDLQPHLIIKNNHTSSKAKCAICGKLFPSRVPMALFLIDPYSHSPFRLVCDHCGERYSPILAKLLRFYYDETNSTTGFNTQA